MATYKLHTYPGNFRAFKILVAAQYNGVDIEVPDFDMATNKSAEFLAKNPLGKVPVLETEKGCIFESNAIARFVARIRRDTELYGASFFESAQIDSWLDFCTHEIELPATMWFYPVFGYMPFNAAATAKAKEDLKKALGVLEKHLLHRTYLVGDQVTLADIVLASALIYPMKLLMDKGFRKPFTCVVRWFNTCVNQPQFKAVVGDVPLAAKMLTAAGDDGKAPAGGKGGGKKGGKEPKKKQEKKKKEPKPAPAPKPKKVEHPLSVWMKEKKPKMHPDEWKKTYKNGPHTGGYRKAVASFWDMIDRDNYSLWICRYNYNEDNSQLWMTSNAIGGFCERMEEIRKYTMGVQSVTGKEGKGNIFISGCWLFLGDTNQHALNCNPDAEYYTWTEISKDKWDDADTRKMVEEFWCSAEETDTVEGRPYYDSKVFV